MEPVNLLKILNTDVSLRMQPGSPRHWALLTLAEVGEIPQNHPRNPCSESLQITVPVSPRACRRAGGPSAGSLVALVDKALCESQAEMNCFNEITESSHSGFPLPVLRGVRECTWMFCLHGSCVTLQPKPQSITLVHPQAHSSCPPWVEHTLGCCISCWICSYMSFVYCRTEIWCKSWRVGALSRLSFVLKQPELQFAGGSEASSWKPVCGTRLGCIPSEGGRADRKWNVPENQVSQNCLVLFAGVSCVLKITDPMEINHCPGQAVLEGEIGVLATVPCCRVFSWDDWYLKTVAVHQGFKNVTFYIYIL